MSDSATPSLKGRRILLIEDDAVLLRSLATQLTQAGSTVAVAQDGRVGLEKFKEFQPDLVITDIIMPEREGIETIVAIKAIRPDTRILAISGGGRVGAAEFLKLALSLGADAALAKPFRSGELVARAAELLEQVPGS